MSLFPTTNQEKPYEQLLHYSIEQLTILFHRTPINYLLVNLAAADMCYVTFVTPTIFLSHDVDHPKGIAGTILCAVVTGGGLAHIGAEASLFTVLAVAFERYFAVVHPYGNRGKLTFHKVKVCFFEMKCYAGRNLSRPYAGTC